MLQMPVDARNQLFRVACLLTLITGFVTPRVRAATPSRTQMEILADLAEAALPKVDVAAMADPAYAESFAKHRDTVRQKRAELIRELFHVAPKTPDMAKYLSERWQTLVQHQEVDLAIEEMNAYLVGHAEPLDKQAVAFQRAQTIIQHQAKDRWARLNAVYTFKSLAHFDEPKVLTPQLLYLAARMETDSVAKQKQLETIVDVYPNAPISKVIRGTNRRQDAIGKTMTATFNDAITGTPIDLTDFRGKVVVVDFWAAWCTDCAAEMPYMKKIYADFKDKGVAFIGVSLDVPEAEGGLDALKKGVARHKLKWPQYYLGKEWDSDFSSDWGVYSIPAVFVLDRQGKVVNTDASGKLETILPDLLKSPAQ